MGLIPHPSKQHISWQIGLYGSGCCLVLLPKVWDAWPMLHERKRTVSKLFLIKVRQQYAAGKLLFFNFYIRFNLL